MGYVTLNWQRISPTFIALLMTTCHLVAITVFLKGYLLTRFELGNVSQCRDPDLSWYESHIKDENNRSSCWSEPAFDRTVVFLVDALRFDFVFEGDLPPGMPELLRMLHEAGPDAAAAFKFIADTPSVTSSRLKAMLTGNLPTFLDVGESFSAATMAEDNLLTQMSRHGMKVVVMGDDTWAQLAPPHTTTARHTFPSFNVRDLDTVDDGVWRLLLPYLRPNNGSQHSPHTAAGEDPDLHARPAGAPLPEPYGPGSWDVLVAHYLGVDHAGHTYGAASPQMYDKLRQMDEQAAAVAEELLAGGGPGGPYSRTLLLVMGDHGQTLTGDHGGGSAEEVDTVMVAFNVGRWRAAREEQQQQKEQQEQRRREQEDTGRGEGVGEGHGDGGEHKEAVVTGVAGVEQGEQREAARPESMLQNDLTPTWALLLGLPVPFGNLGAVNRRLWELGWPRSGAEAAREAVGVGSAAEPVAAGADASENGGARLDSVGQQGSSHPPVRMRAMSYAEALHSNAVQVDLYLRTYAAATRGAFPSRDLVALQQLLDRAREARERLRGLLLLPLPQDAPQQRSACASCKTHGSTRDPNVSSEESDAPAAAAGSANGAAARDFPSAEVGAEEAQRCTAQTVAQAEAEAVAAYRAFLAAAGDLARRKFTRFGLPAIGAGCCLVLGCLAVHLVVLGRLCPWRLLLSPLSVAAMCLSLLHACGLFSAGWMQREGRITCVSLAAATLALWLRAAAAPAPTPSPRFLHTPEPDASPEHSGGCVVAVGSLAAASVPITAAAGRRACLSPAHQPGLHRYGVSTCRWGRQLLLLAAAAVALGCNLGLQRYSLLDPWGRSEGPGAQDTGAAFQQSAGVHGQRAAGGGGSGAAAALWAWTEVQLPLWLLPVLFAVLQWRLGRRSGQLVVMELGGDATSMARCSPGAPAARETEAQRIECGGDAWPVVRVWAGHVLPYMVASAWWALQLAAAAGGEGAREGAWRAAATLSTADLVSGVVKAWERWLPAAVSLQAERAAVHLEALWQRGLAVVWAPHLRALASTELARFLANELASAAASALRLPLRLLLPRVVYALAALSLVRLVWGWYRSPVRGRSQAHPGRTAAAATEAEQVQCTCAAFQLVFRVLSSFVAVVVLLLGRRGPAISLALWAQAVSLVYLGLEGSSSATGLYSAGASSSSGNSSSPGPSHRPGENGDSGADARTARFVGPTRTAPWVEAPPAPTAAQPPVPGSSTGVHGPPRRTAARVLLRSIWAAVQEGGRAGRPESTVAALSLLLCLLGSNAFFLTGHFCEFSGLQYDSPFVGYDTMSYPTTPILFWLNTFGGLMVTAMALPLLAAAVAAHARSPHGAVPAAGTCGDACATGTCALACAGDVDVHTAVAEQAVGASSSSATLTGISWHWLACVGAVCYSLGRSCCLAVAVLSAAIQLHHVMLWAPKLVFEVCFTASADVALLVAAVGMGRW